MAVKLIENLSAKFDRQNIQMNTAGAAAMTQENRGDEVVGQNPSLKEML